LWIVQQAASALAAAHAKGIVHRDIKPENLFLLRRKEQDFVKVVDFGISKSLRASSEEEEQPRLTQTGMVLGTPLYMSPEQARGDDELDHRVDIYALGVIMYEASTGRVPFAGNNYLSVISQVLNEEPKPLRVVRPELSEEFEAIVLRAMAKSRTDRYASATDMLADLSAVIDDPTRSTERAKITGPRRKIPRKGSLRIAAWVGAIGVLVIALLMGVKMLMGSPKEPAQVRDAPAIAPVIDAAPLAVAPDAPAEPAAEMIELEVISTPPGAIVIKDGIQQDGVTPMPLHVVKKDKEVKIIVQRDGFNDYEITFNPVEGLPKDRKLRAVLKKPPVGQPVQHKTIPKTDGSGQRPPDKTNGEFGGNPFLGSGTVPKK
jgi:hypothetical protein